MCRLSLLVLTAVPFLDILICLGLRVDDDDDPAIDRVDPTVAGEIRAIGGSDDDALLDETELFPDPAGGLLPDEDVAAMEGAAGVDSNSKAPLSPHMAPSSGLLDHAPHQVERFAVDHASATVEKLAGKKQEMVVKSGKKNATSANGSPVNTTSAEDSPVNFTSTVKPTVAPPPVDPLMPPEKAEMLAEKADELAAKKQEVVAKLQAEEQNAMAQMPAAKFNAKKLVTQAVYDHSLATAEQRSLEHAQVQYQAKVREEAARQARQRNIDPNEDTRRASANLITASEDVPTALDTYHKAEDAESEARDKLQNAQVKAEAAARDRDAAERAQQQLSTAAGFYQWEDEQADAVQQLSGSAAADTVDQACKQQAKKNEEAYEAVRQEASLKSGSAEQGYREAEGQVLADEKLVDAASNAAAQKLAEVEKAKVMRDAAVQALDIAERPFNPRVPGLPTVPQTEYSVRKAKQRAKDLRGVYDHMTHSEREAALRAER